MPGIKSVSEADVAGKRVLVAVDLNVPVREGKVQGDMRIHAILPTLELLHQKGAAKIILLSHLGRPGGKVVEELRMAPVEARLKELTQVPCEVHENLRFDPREEANDEEFAKELAALGDVYVNEAFSDSHRTHASIVALPKLLPHYVGLRFVDEMRELNAALTPPQGAVALIGGAKFETKEPFIQKILSLYSEILLGGALGDDLLKARGLPFGASLISEGGVSVEVASSERLVVPQDVVVVEGEANAERTAFVADIRRNERVVDIGPHTAHAWSEKLSKASFVLWNGPMGIYEEGYADGTDALAAALVASGVWAVIGGGDTAAAVRKYKFDPAKVFISTGGGAMLQFLTEGTLPGIEALKS